MSIEKIAYLVKEARKGRDETKRDARSKYRLAGAQLRKKRKRSQRKRRRIGGQGLKARVERQKIRLKMKPVRIRREPLIKRPRDMS